jgi:endonuclease/exonuclease/phosphatase family metal-dependent hydrolase
LPLESRIASFGAPVQKLSRLRIVSYNIQWGVTDPRPPYPGSPIATRRKAAAEAAAASKKQDARDALGRNHSSVDDRLEAEPSSKLGVVVNTLQDLPVALETRHYRQHTLLREIVEWSPDVACLQEVLPAVHDDFLAPLLSARGFESTLAGELALVWRRDRFELAGSEMWVIGDLLDDPVNADIVDALDHAASHVKEHFVGLPHVAQVALLRQRSLNDNDDNSSNNNNNDDDNNNNNNKAVAIVNVHLVMDRYADHFRALQLALVVRRMRQWAPEIDAGDAHLFVCGDFNTRGAPHSSYLEAALQLLRTGAVGPNHPCFVLGRDVGRPKQAGMRHSVPFVDRSARNDANSSAGNADVAPTQCEVRLGGDPWSPQCPNDATLASGNKVCWDHGCRKCAARKEDFRQPLCVRCEQNGVAVPPLPASVEEGLFRCRLDLVGVRGATSIAKGRRDESKDVGGDADNDAGKDIVNKSVEDASCAPAPKKPLGDNDDANPPNANRAGPSELLRPPRLELDSAARSLPRSANGFGQGDEHRYAFYTADFHPGQRPPSKIPRKHPFIELRDHIFFSTSTLRPVKFAPPPPPSDLKGALPGLAFSSDHLAIAADFEDKQQC